MSGSSGCSGDGFFRSELPVALFGGFDAEVAEQARRLRFILRRRDPEFLEIVVGIAAPVEGPGALLPVLPPALPRRNRRVRGLEAEFDEVVAPASRRRRLR